MNYEYDTWGEEGDYNLDTMIDECLFQLGIERDTGNEQIIYYYFHAAYNAIKRDREDLEKRRGR